MTSFKYFGPDQYPIKFEIKYVKKGSPDRVRTIGGSMIPPNRFTNICEIPIIASTNMYIDIGEKLILSKLRESCNNFNEN